MKKAQNIPDPYAVFASVLVMVNRMETLLSRELMEFGVTTKQWFLAATIQNVFERPPTMKAVAGAMGSSHQNIKQVAGKLQQKGLLQFEKDKKDGRVTRLRMTEVSYGFWKKTEPKGAVFIERMFKGIDADKLAVTKTVLKQMLANLAEMDQTVTEEPEEV